MQKLWAVAVLAVLASAPGCGSGSSNTHDAGSGGVSANGGGGAKGGSGGASSLGSGGRGETGGGKGGGSGTGGGGTTGSTGGRAGATGGAVGGGTGGGDGNGTGGGPGGRGGGGGQGSATGGRGGAAGGSSEPPSCSLLATVTYGMTGGHVAYEDSVTLTPPAAYKHTRRNSGSTTADVTCAPPLPACGTPNLLDVLDINEDMQDPAVQAALAMTSPPLYGRDDRPADGAIFSLLRADGRGFLAGAACAQGGGACADVPAGIARLVTDLRALDQQQLNDLTCASLRSPQ